MNLGYLQSVDYEKTFPLELVNLGTDEGLGIVFEMRSIDSAAAERVLLEHTDKQIERLTCPVSSDHG